MNGISVMGCVQSAYGYEYQGAQRKRIRISPKREDGNVRAHRQPGSMNRPACGAGTFRAAKTGKRPAGFTESRRGTQTGGPAAKDLSAGSTSARKHPGNSLSVSRTCASKGEMAGLRSAVWIRAALFAAVFTFMLAGFCIMTRASSREKEQVWKYYTTVTIGSGEDLTDIVFQYCDSDEYACAEDYVREICEINCLPWHKGTVPDLGPGTQIVIPYYSTEYK